MNFSPDWPGTLRAEGGGGAGGGAGIAERRRDTCHGYYKSCILLCSAGIAVVASRKPDN